MTVRDPNGKRQLWEIGTMGSVFSPLLSAIGLDCFSDGCAQCWTPFPFDALLASDSLYTVINAKERVHGNKIINCFCSAAGISS